MRDGDIRKIRGKTMTIEVREYKDADKADWEDFLKRSNNGTIFHSVDFLAYHQKDKFNENHLIFTKKGIIISILPAAIFYDNDGKKVLKSPYGASFGGFVTLTQITLKDSSAILDTFLEYLKHQEIEKVYLTNPPPIYCKIANNYLDFCLIKNNFLYTKRELTSVIPLHAIDEPLYFIKKRARTSVRKAIKEGVSIAESDDYTAFYEILVESKKKFEDIPTHSLDDLLTLKKLIPKRIKLFTAFLDEKPIASAFLFICNEKAFLVFYICHLLNYEKYCPVNLLLYEVIKWGINQRFQYMDLGTSTVDMVPYWSLIDFKESFNSVGYFRDTLSINLKE